MIRAEAWCASSGTAPPRSAPRIPASITVSANTAAFGLYSDRTQLDEGISALLAARFRSEDISVLFSDNDGTKDFALEKGTKAPEGAAAGAGTGGAIGGTLGLLVGLGALAIPGLGPLIAAGPIVSALAGLGAGGVVGGFVGTLVGMGIPEYEAKREPHGG